MQVFFNNTKGHDAYLSKNVKRSLIIGGETNRLVKFSFYNLDSKIRKENSKIGQDDVELETILELNDRISSVQILSKNDSSGFAFSCWDSKIWISDFCRFGLHFKR